MSDHRPDFAVLQIGARLHYAVPAVLERAGMLRMFYTDAARTGLLSTVARLWPRSMRPALADRLFTRELPADLPHGKVRTVDARSVAAAVVDRLGPRAKSLSKAMSPHAALRRQLSRRAFEGANSLYVLDNGDLELVREARERGLFVVYEQICSPEIGRILHEERERYPGVEPQDSLELIEAGIAEDVKVWNASDLVLTASAHVTDAAVRLGAPKANIREVPYGIQDDWLTVRPSGDERRILFVGRVGLPKGAHYFAQTARALSPKYPGVQFRAVGAVDRARVELPLFRGPAYAGIVPRDRMKEELARAYAIVLPTLSEGFGLVLLEAMACGVPVITTVNSGAMARDGVEGFIVPIRDSPALEDRVQRLLDDRALRDRMGAAARERAREYTWSRYAERLTAAIRDGFARHVASKDRAA